MSEFLKVPIPLSSLPIPKMVARIYNKFEKEESSGLKKTIFALVRNISDQEALQ
jgi:hypothetical protein